MEEGSPGQYDIMTTFDLIHELPNPALGLETLKHSMAKDEMFLLMDIEATKNPVDNPGSYGVFKLGISLHFLYDHLDVSGRRGYVNGGSIRFCIAQPLRQNSP